MPKVPKRGWPTWKSILHQGSIWVCRQNYDDNDSDDGDGDDDEYFSECSL